MEGDYLKKVNECVGGRSGEGRGCLAEGQFFHLL